MPKSFLIKPADIEQRLLHRFNTHCKKWLAGEGDWPLNLPLGIPTEDQAAGSLDEVKNWQKTWLDWHGEGEIKWVERRWANLGVQRLPERILIPDPSQLVRWIGKDQLWSSATERYAAIVNRWPQIAGVLPKYFKVLTDYSDADFRRLFSVLEWFETHPDSNLYIRQLPIEGIDTKWISPRKSLISEWLGIIKEIDRGKDFYGLTGLRHEPVTIRVRILDNHLRSLIGNIGDISLPISDLQQLHLPVKKVYIVENLQTGLAFGDIPGAIVFMGLGYAVDLLGEIDWLNNLPIYYWGDIDTDGYAILNRVRSYFPHARSILMDEATLIDHNHLWGKDEKTVSSTTLLMLTEEEKRLYEGLCNHNWAKNLRLEQERIPWDYAWDRLCLL